MGPPIGPPSNSKNGPRYVWREEPHHIGPCTRIMIDFRPGPATTGFGGSSEAGTGNDMGTAQSAGPGP